MDDLEHLRKGLSAILGPGRRGAGRRPLRRGDAGDDHLATALVRYLLTHGAVGLGWEEVQHANLRSFVESARSEARSALALIRPH